MNAPAIISLSSIPSLIDRAAGALTAARTAAEILEARDIASFAYDAAKRAARLSKAKDAHDTLIAAAYRAQADALEIESQAKRRLADEYDAAQERGEVRSDGQRGKKAVPDKNSFSPATAQDIGLSRKQIHEARQVRDAERASPGIVRRALDACLLRGQEPSKASLRQAMLHVAQSGYASAPSARRNPLYQPDASYDLVASVAGTCRTLIEKTKGHDLASLLAGCANAEMRTRTLGDLRECRDRLNDLLEEDDAAEA